MNLWKYLLNKNGGFMSIYDVYVNDELRMSINPNLVKSQGVSESGVKAIVKLHICRIKLEDSFDKLAKNQAEYFNKWTEIQFKLQRAWGFKEDVNMHKFWTMKGCSCPVSDNEDRYPSKSYIYSNNCCVHSS